MEQRSDIAVGMMSHEIKEREQDMASAEDRHHGLETTAIGGRFIFPSAQRFGGRRVRDHRPGGI
jgi:hypothetical protein